MSTQYEELQIKELLESLGKGKGMTGSGGAAALSALMGAELLVSVCKITMQKEAYNDVQQNVQNAEGALTQVHIPMLKKLMQQDVDAVSRLIKENEVVQELTTTPIAICNESLSVIGWGVKLFDEGYKIMKGDVAVALSLCLGVVQATLFIARGNLLGVKDEAIRVGYEAEIQDMGLKFTRATLDIKERLEL